MGNVVIIRLRVYLGWWRTTKKRVVAFDSLEWGIGILSGLYKIYSLNRQKHDKT